MRLLFYLRESRRPGTVSQLNSNGEGPAYRACIHLLLAFTLLGFGVGCKQKSTSPSPSVVSPAKSEESITNYSVRGVVRELKADGKTVIIRHEDIPGFMPAMTMPFAVKDVSELKGLASGDTVEFRMRVTGTDGWIDQIKRQDPIPTSTAPLESPSVNVLPNVPILSPGDDVPDYTLTNQLGKQFQLSDFRGRTLAVTFIFTRCPFPTFCPTSRQPKVSTHVFPLPRERNVYRAQCL